MKSGTEYAKRIKKLFTRLKKEYGTPPKRDPTDPVDQLLFGILHRGTTTARAEKGLASLLGAMVDRNELRVSTPSELVELLGPGFQQATEKARALTQALNDVFARYHEIDLEDLKTKGKRDARKILEELDGVDPSTAAGIMLFSLDGHAVPVDENMLAVLREEELVHPDADVAEVQAFLERNVSASNAQAFTVLLRRYSEERAKKSGRSKPSRRTRKASSSKAKKKTADKRKTSSRASTQTRKTASKQTSRGKSASPRSPKKKAAASRKTTKTSSKRPSRRKTSASKSR
ncbi:MAG: hypothetical protein JXQ73_01805 [Phycisphaerae bacterium]|nr:hypothetical protein [Phycisphaerae bacterium]